MRISLALLVTLAAGGAVPPAAAQQAPLVSLAPANPARWEAAGFGGWTGSNRAHVAARENEWADAATAGGAVGYYWTPHLKVEGDASLTTWGSVFVQEPIVGPGGTEAFRFGEHRTRSVRASAAVAYQFGSNAWFHPFVAGGIEGSRLYGELDLQRQPLCAPTFCAPVALPPQSTVSTRVRPLAAAGFKWYVTERTFIRSELRATFSARRTDAVHWRLGIGADF